MSDSETNLDRRSVLEIIGSTAAAGIGLGATAGSAGATPSTHRLEREYSDERRLRTAFERHGEQLLQTLRDEGLLADDFDFGALEIDIDEDVDGLQAAAESRSAAVSAHAIEGTTTVIGVVPASSDTHDLSLYVQPQRDRAYAVAEPHDGDDRLLATDDGVTTADCTYIECTEDCCDAGFTYQYTYECPDTCEENCEIVDIWCNCSTFRC